MSKYPRFLVIANSALGRGYDGPDLASGDVLRSRALIGGSGDVAGLDRIAARCLRQALQGSRITAAGRRELDADGFRHMAEAALRDHAGPGKLDPDRLAVFLAMLDYVRIDAEGEDGWAVQRHRT